MKKVIVYNQDGKKEQELELNPTVFEVAGKKSVVHQAYITQLINARQTISHTKDRGEVSGGGKKPWKQKGTGRARHGSIRSPIWRGGGITFGPTKEKVFKQKINKKARRLAVRMCLTDKVAQEKLIVVNSLAVKDAKTKLFAKILSHFAPMKGRSVLVLSSDAHAEVKRSARNIPNLTIDRATNVNVVELLHNQFVVTTPEGIGAITKLLATSKRAAVAAKK